MNRHERRRQAKRQVLQVKRVRVCETLEQKLAGLDELMAHALDTGAAWEVGTLPDGVVLLKIGQKGATFSPAFARKLAERLRVRSARPFGFTLADQLEAAADDIIAAMPTAGTA